MARMKRITLTDDTRAAILAEFRASRAFTMTDEEVDAARRADPDALPPMTDAEIDAAKGEAVRRVRRATGLTQAAFAAAYGIPLGTLRDWEQGKATPDATARTYLRVIGVDPDGVRRALAA